MLPFCTLNPHLTGVWGISKSGIYLGCTLLGVESTSEIKPSPTAASLVYSLRCKAASNAQLGPAARKHIQRSEGDEEEKKKTHPPYISHFTQTTEFRFQAAVQLTLTYSHAFFFLYFTRKKWYISLGFTSCNVWPWLLSEVWHKKCILKSWLREKVLVALLQKRKLSVCCTSL